MESTSNSPIITDTLSPSLVTSEVGFLSWPPGLILVFELLLDVAVVDVDVAVVHVDALVVASGAVVVGSVVVDVDCG